MDPARAARAARLLAEFRAILDSSLAEQDSSTQAGSSLQSNPPQSVSRGDPGSVPAPKPMAAATSGGNPAVLWPKNPQLDYSGFACEFFTRPPKAGEAVDTHADGTWIAYGERMYQCVNRRWRLEGPAAAYAGAQDRQALVIER